MNAILFPINSGNAIPFIGSSSDHVPNGIPLYRNPANQVTIVVFKQFMKPM